MTHPTHDLLERLDNAFLYEAHGEASDLPERAAEAIRELEAENMRLREWRPIETAPKDGTDILAVIAGRHQQSGQPFIPEVIAWDESDECWWNCMWGYDNAHSEYRPTHWKPLPDTSAISGETGK